MNTVLKDAEIAVETDATQVDATQDTLTPELLQALLEEARAKLDELARSIGAVDAELESLSDARTQYRALQTACDALDELRAIGGAELFWDGSTPVGARDVHMARVRARIEEFHERVGEIEGRRRKLVQEMSEQHGETEMLEDDAFEAQEEEERRRNEWIVEREIEALRSHPSMMAWTRGLEDDQRFRKTLSTALLVCLLFALIVPFIKLPLRALQEEAEPYAKHDVIVMLPKEALPPPPPLPPKPREKLVQQKPMEKPQPTAAQDQPQAEEQVQDQGILAFRDKLESIKETPIVASLGAKAQINSDDSAARPDRSMLTTNAPGSSGGIKLAALSRSVGGGTGDARGAVQGSALTRASSGIRAAGPGNRPLSSGPGPSRTDEEIQIVFDRYKAALYRLYNRELRRDPTLQGKMILRLTIEPDGSVSFCQLHSSDMNAPDLSAQVVGRVKTFDFGAKEVPAVTIVYPIDFLPAA
ncbi:MAG TPA: AgmX/PglI C-terminal domain-containing protein [Vicinamibacterales bacterium]|nr:AgmX/PglI C-terminal domain-containing protein [Vicinamibacterales bacterium]